MSDITYLTNLTGNDKAFKNLPEEKIYEIVELCNKYNFIYEPYNETFINPLLDIAYKSNKVVNIDLTDLEKHLAKAVQDVTNSLGVLSYEQVRASIDRSNYRYNQQYFFIRKLRWLGVVVGTLTAFFYNIDFGLFIGLFLIYLDYNYFDFRNTMRDKFELAGTSRLWAKNKNLYFIGTLFLNIASLYFLYSYTNSYWIPALLLFATRICFEYYTRKALAMSWWWGQGLLCVEENLRRQQIESGQL